MTLARISQFDRLSRKGNAASRAAQAGGRPARGLSLIVALLLPGAALADPLLDRYAAASLVIEDRLFAFYVLRAPELEPVLPVMGWDEEIEAVAICTFDGIRAQQGEAGVEAFVAAFEVFAATPITSLSTFGRDQSPVLQQPLILELAQSCGSFLLTARRMQASGMTELLESDPSIADRLMAP
jgi:hypothetical protein